MSDPREDLKLTEDSLEGNLLLTLIEAKEEAAKLKKRTIKLEILIYHLEQIKKLDITDE